MALLSVCVCVLLLACVGPQRGLSASDLSASFDGFSFCECDDDDNNNDDDASPFQGSI